MNYYERHIGDLIKNTAHLSMIEDGAYNRLLDVYYTREGPLPGTLKECWKLARATSKAERDAVSYVLAEFFELRDDGYHQARCDEVIAQYAELEPEREAKRDAERERQRRSRERRRDMFEKLRSFGVVPPFDTSMSELQKLLSDAEKRVTPDVRHAPVTRDNTATHSPLPNTQSSSNQLRGNDDDGTSNGVTVDVTAWSPGDDAMLAIELERSVPVEFAGDVLTEFRAFWAGKARRTPGEWLSRFLQRVDEQWLRRQRGAA